MTIRCGRKDWGVVRRILRNEAKHVRRRISKLNMELPGIIEQRSYENQKSNDEIRTIWKDGNKKDASVTTYPEQPEVKDDKHQQ